MITNTHNALSNVFDVTPVKNTLVKSEVKVSDDSDLQLSTDTAKAMLEKGADIIETASLIAAGTEDPAMFTAIASLMSSMNKTNDHLLKVHTIKNPVVKQQEVQSGETVINNPQAVFVGSTTDFARKLSELRKQQ